MSLRQKIGHFKKPFQAKKRVGRGYGSGKGGHTTGSGQKGQKSRGTSKIKPGFAGRSTPLHRKLPKFRGSHTGNLGKKVKATPINLNALEAKYKTGEIVSKATLTKKGIINGRVGVIKILGFGNLTKKLTFSGVTMSKTAQTKIDAIK